MRFWRLRSRRDERGKTCFQFPCLWCCLWPSDCPGHTMGHLDWTDIDNWHRVSWLCPAPASSDCPGVIYTLAIVTTLTILRDTQSRERDTHKLFLLGNWKLTVTRESAASGDSLTARSESKCCLGPFSCSVYNDHPGLSRHNASEEHQGRFWDEDI